MNLYKYLKTICTETIISKSVDGNFSVLVVENEVVIRKSNDDSRMM